MWQKLASNMAYIIKQYQQLLSLNDEKRKALVLVDMKALEDVVNREQDVITAINKAEHTRQDILRSMSETNNQISAQMKMRDLLRQCTDPAKRDQLSKLHKLLDKLVKDVQEASDNNAIITQAALNAVNFKLNQLGGTAVEQSYGSRGQEQVSHQKNFDFQA